MAAAKASVSGDGAVIGGGGSAAARLPAAQASVSPSVHGSLAAIWVSSAPVALRLVTDAFHCAIVRTSVGSGGIDAKVGKGALFEASMIACWVTGFGCTGGGFSVGFGCAAAGAASPAPASTRVAASAE